MPGQSENCRTIRFGNIFTVTLTLSLKILGDADRDRSLDGFNKLLVRDESSYILREGDQDKNLTIVLKTYWLLPMIC